jgi:hypothetical protein
VTTGSSTATPSTPAAPSDKPESKLTSAGRRWSMALSSLGFSQNSAHSLHSLSDSQATPTQHKELPKDSLNTPSTGKESSKDGAHSSPASGYVHNSERRISFVLTEEDAVAHGSPHSSNATLTNEVEATMQAHSNAIASQLSKRQSASAASIPTRPHLLRRATGTVTSAQAMGLPTSAPFGNSMTGGAGGGIVGSGASGGGGSFKRRSIRLRKDRRTKRSSTLIESDRNLLMDDDDASCRRADSLRSRRKVSGISERSDTSERVDLSDDSGANGSEEMIGTTLGLGGSGDTSNVPGAAPGELIVMDGSRRRASHVVAGGCDGYDQLEEDDSGIAVQQPWLRICVSLMHNLDYTCTHSYCCTANCYRRQMRSCSRLVRTVKTIYKRDPSSSHDRAFLNSLDLTGGFEPFDNMDGGVLDGATTGGKDKSTGCRSCTSGATFGEWPTEKLTSNGPFHSVALNCTLTTELGRKNERKLRKMMAAAAAAASGGSSRAAALAGGHVGACGSPHGRKHSQDSQQRLIGAADLVRDLESGQGPAAKAGWPARRCNHAPDQSAPYLSQTLRYVQLRTRNLFHVPISLLVKCYLILPTGLHEQLLELSWQLLLETDQHLACSAAVAFILCSLRCPEQASALLQVGLSSKEPAEQISAILKFQALWRFRYQCWPRMEENAQSQLKLPPPMIEFTLPSPKIAQATQPVADPPWVPATKYKVEEVTINQEQTLQRSFVTATKTRRKQQLELIQKALADEKEKLKEERQAYRLSAVPIAMHASYEPALHRADEHEEDGEELAPGVTTQHLQVVQPIFTSALCSAALTLINLLLECNVNATGSAVYEVAYKVVWQCLVEDASLFLRNLFERLTRDQAKEMLQILRRLIRFMPRLPAQAAYSLYNYLIGFIMFNVRTPISESPELIGTTLSVLWLVVPSVHGLFLKDLKQILRKEQCDTNVLITANVPSAKKIIVHGPDVGAIPSQFPVHEDTQFAQILVDSLDYFSIDEKFADEYFLVDSKSNQMHNLSAFVRDFYFFKRSQYPQLSLIKMNPELAAEQLQKQAFTQQFCELGKVLMSFSIVNSSYLAIQRVLFLHEELMKLPAFPRKALEMNLQLYQGASLGRPLLTMDTLHKQVWVMLIGRMLEVTSGFFNQSADVHLFLNVVNGAMMLHCEDASIMRFCLATYINAANQFRNIFSSNGFLLVMPTLLRIYSNHQTNQLLCRSIEFVTKQFYVMHRKPFILQVL